MNALLRRNLPALMIATIACVLLVLATGATLGTFLGALLLVAILVPTLPGSLPGVLVPVILTCMGASIAARCGFVAMLEVLLVLLSFAAAVARGGVVVALLSLLWLTWPVWLSAHLNGGGANITLLVRISPVFAINGAMPELGTWTHQPIAYRNLTNLGQDVPYSLPTSVIPCAFFHLLLAGASWAVSWGAMRVVWKISSTAARPPATPP